MPRWSRRNGSFPWCRESTRSISPGPTPRSTRSTIVFRVLGGIDGGAKADAKVGEKADAKAADKESPALDVKVLSVSYPPNEAALVWQVSSSDSGSARVRISYLLGNLTKSFNYRAVAANDEKTLVLSEYIRIQNLANESFGSTGLWAGFGPRFLKPIGLNETKEMLVEKFAEVPVKKTYTCDPAGPRLPRPPAEQAAGADALRAEERQGQPPGRRAVAIRQGPHLPGRRPRRHGLHRRGLGQVHPAGRRDAALRRRGPGRGRQTHHRQERAAPHRRQPVRPRSGRQVRDRELQGQGRRAGHLGKRAGDPQRAVWRQRPGRAVGTGQGHDLRRGAGQGEEHLRAVALPRPLPARGADAKAEKIVHKLHLVIKNEW